MAKKQLRVGLIGYSFMGRAHSNAFHQVNHFFPSSYEIVPQAVCGRDEAKVKEFADRWGYKSTETDWKKLIARDDIDVIDIATPNNLHAEQAIAAAKAGKMILCEKPLAMNAKQAEVMVKAIEKAKVPNMVWYNYRRCPAVVLAKNMIDAGNGSTT
jgi:predicted dehydrogenase